jgi:hypothetical protein
MGSPPGTGSGSRSGLRIRIQIRVQSGSVIYGILSPYMFGSFSKILSKKYVFFIYTLRRSRKTLTLGSSGSGTKKAGAETLGEETEFIWLVFLAIYSN